MPKRKKVNLKPLKATNYEKSTRIVDLIKICRLNELNNQMTLDVIKFETGKDMTLNELKPLIESAKKEIKEQQIQVDEHMDYMIRIGLYQDTMKHHSQLSMLERMLFGMILAEYNKPEADRNNNFILNAMEKLTKIHASMNNTITNIGFLSKAKSIIEQNSQQDDGKGTIIVEKKTPEIEQLVDEAIDVQEFEDNKVF